MNKVYLSNNYIIVDKDGDVTPYPRNHSEYNEYRDHFILIKHPNIHTTEFRFETISSWFDESGTIPYTKEDLRIFLRQNTGFNWAPTSSGAAFIGESAQNYSSLLPGAFVGQVSYVKESQGTKWLPGNVGGNYYPKGWYIWDGSTWTSDRNTIAEQFELNQSALDNKAEQSSLLSEINNRKQSDGWWNITDQTYTDSNPLVLEQGVREKLVINSDNVTNGFGANNLNADSIWDPITSSFKPIALGDSYIFRLTGTGSPLVNNSNLKIELDIGGSQGVIWEETISLSRGADIGVKFVTTNSIFSLSTFIANGGDFYVTCDGIAEIYDLSLFIQKITEQ